MKRIVLACLMGVAFGYALRGSDYKQNVSTAPGQVEERDFSYESMLHTCIESENKEGTLIMDIKEDVPPDITNEQLLDFVFQVNMNYDSAQYIELRHKGVLIAKTKLVVGLMHILNIQYRWVYEKGTGLRKHYMKTSPAEIVARELLLDYSNIPYDEPFIDTLGNAWRHGKPLK